MACDVSLGRLEPCKKDVGGLVAIYFINYTAGLLTGSSAATFGTDDLITGFNSALTLYKYDLRGTNSFDETNENSRENGTSVFTQTGTIQLKKQDAATRKEMKLLGYGRPQIIIQSYDTSPGAGDLPIYKYQIAGIENGCEVAASSVSGAAMADFTGYNLVFTGMERESAYFVDPSIIGDTTNTVVVVGT
jgi:hypothetical protein